MKKIMYAPHTQLAIGVLIGSFHHCDTLNTDMIMTDNMYKNGSGIMPL
ncbi:MAG: hypothetical protein HUK05_08100 [Prevotella sp.]|nr:hypothetical protein [Prevotella sp.]